MNLKRRHKAFAVILAVVVMMALGSVAYAASYSGSEHYNQNLYMYNKTWYTPGHKLSSGKYAKSCWSKIEEGSREDLKRSATLTSSQAKSTSTPKQQATAQLFNNPLKSASYSHGWSTL